MLLLGEFYSLCMISIFLVDDHPMVTEGVENIIARSGVKCKLKVFHSAEDLLAATKSVQPDMVISDISLPKMDGIEMAKLLKQDSPSIRILFLTMHQQNWRINEMLKLKANGIVFKTCPAVELQNAIVEVAKGGTYFSPQAKELIVSVSLNSNSISLTTREKDVLKLIAKGLKTFEIAETLCLSENTVEGYRKVLFQKLEVNNATKLLSKAVDLGIIE